MPIVNFHLVTECYDRAAIAGLLEEASHFYARTMYAAIEPPPIDRVRAFVTAVAPQHWMTGARPVSDGGEAAPYFTCLALADRPVTQLHLLLEGFTDLIEKHLACRRDVIRGQVIPIDPAHWSIGGRPASQVRGDEGAARRTA